ncbi:hypothetical protein XM50_01730 [Sphingomonas sp. Ag1]|nr:hypothetical protein XM50_01730 [Sphingomonas sp. Ag1]
MDDHDDIALFWTNAIVAQQVQKAGDLLQRWIDFIRRCRGLGHIEQHAIAQLAIGPFRSTFDGCDRAISRYHRLPRHAG